MLSFNGFVEECTHRPERQNGEWRADGDIVYDVHLPTFELPSMHVEDTMPIIQLQLAMGMKVPWKRIIRERDAFNRAVKAHLAGHDIIFSTVKSDQSFRNKPGFDSSKYYDVEAVLKYKEPPCDISEWLASVLYLLLLHDQETRN